MRNEIKDELMQIAPSIAGIGNANNYRVSDDYFEAFADEVMSRIQLPAIQLPFAAPSPDYFKGLAGTIMNKIKSNGTIVEEDNEVISELAALSPLIASIKKENVYTTPTQYFTDFKVDVPVAAQQAKLVPMRRPVRWVRYAAAAAITSIVATSGIFLFKNDHIANNQSASLSLVSDDAINNYLKQSPADMDITPSTFDDNKVNVGYFTEQLLNDVSNADIQEYLQENEQPGEKDIKGI